VSSPAPQNVAIVIIVLTLGGVLLLAVAPFEIGTIRWGGVSLLWWYGGIVAPVVVVATTVWALVRSRAS
jgi:hypothetical protein